MELLKQMLKEEWRLHTALFGTFLFIAFPPILAGIALIFSLLLPFLSQYIPASTMALFVHYVFVLFGLSVGSFALSGREALHRRFGQASLLAYISRSLPISVRTIIATFFVKDLLYYTGLWIVPAIAGYFLASLVMGYSSLMTVVLFISIPLSFLTGISLIFLLSTIYTRSHATFYLLLTAAIIALTVSPYTISQLLTYLPAYQFFLTPTIAPVAISLAFAALGVITSIYGMPLTFDARPQEEENQLLPLAGTLRHQYAVIMSKDILDLRRSSGGMAKIIFSYAFPLAIVGILLNLFISFFPELNFFLIFAIFLGVIGTAVYNWLTQYDTTATYAFLPIHIADIVRRKVHTYAILNTISLPILVGAVIVTGQFALFGIGLVTTLSLNAYTMAVTVYLTGLQPHILLYNGKVFLAYMVALAPLLIGCILLSVFIPLALYATTLLLLPAIFLLRRAMVKWEQRVTI